MIPATHLFGVNPLTRTLARLARALTAWNARRSFRRRLRAYQRARIALARHPIPED